MSSKQQLLSRVVTLCFTVVCASVFAMKAGEPAPAITAKMISGQVFDLKKEKGNVVIINFWASWCPICQEEMPLLNAYYQKHKKEGLKILAISIDDPDEDMSVKKIMKRFGYAAALQRYSDFKGYEPISRTPMFFVVDRNGVLRFDGSQEDSTIDRPFLEKTVTPLLKTTAGS